MATARDHPERTAVRYGDYCLTYRELGRQAMAVACALRAYGAPARVAVCLERHAEMVAALLGTLLGGAAYVPLDPSHPGNRVDFILGEAAPEVLLTSNGVSEKCLGRALPSNLRVLALHDIIAMAGEREVPPIASEPHRPVYVIYTSGSTGVPKGVLMHECAAKNVLEWQIASTRANLMRALQQERPTDSHVVLQYAPLTFDVSFLEIFATLAAGGTLVIPSEMQLRDHGLLLDLVEEQRIGSMYLPGTMLQHVAELAVRLGVYPQSLFEIMSGGEQLRISPNIRRWFAGMPRCTLQNIYGPTEAHVVATSKFSGNPGNWPTLPGIGHPIPKTDIYILDEDLRAVPAGSEGEICIGGICLATGYVNRPDLTADRFVPNPFGESRLYRTGDVGHLLDDGSIMFDGRRDGQVKIRGVRIECAEIENMLEQHPEVQQCVVIAREDRPEDRHLVAYIVRQALDAQRDSHGTTSPLDARWYRFLLDRLPEIMVPRKYMVLSRLPLTSSGKIDRSALPRPSGQRPSLQSAFVEPRSVLERTIAEVWRDYLQIDDVGIDDSFFDLGGHSLLLIRVQNRLSTVLNRDVAASDLLSRPTVRALAAWADGTERFSHREHPSEIAERQERRNATLISRTSKRTQDG